MAETLAERLGFSAKDRVAVVHCDDIGMCHAANEGAFEALANGPATCGSVMVPCPWFAEAARRARENPGLDLGVHLTLGSEYPQYRWGPVAGAAAVPSRVDEEGCFPRTAGEVVEQAKPEEVEVELRAQLERALAAGIDVTHLDAHQGTCLMPPFAPVYAALARRYRLALFIVRPDAQALALLGRESAPSLYSALIDFAPGDGEAHNARRLAGLGVGINYLVCHPARGGEELSAITPDAHARDFERSFYGGDAGRRALEAAGVRSVGMRPLRDLVRAGS